MKRHLHKLSICIGIAILSLFSSCSKENSVYPSDRVCLYVGESQVVELDGNVEIFEDSVRLQFEDTGVCRLSDITPHKVTVTGLKRGADILHIEYTSNRSGTGYSSLDLIIEVI